MLRENRKVGRKGRKSPECLQVGSKGPASESQHGSNQHRSIRRGDKRCGCETSKKNPLRRDI